MQPAIFLKKTPNCDLDLLANDIVAIAGLAIDDVRPVLYSGGGQLTGPMTEKEARKLLNRLSILGLDLELRMAASTYAEFRKAAKNNEFDSTAAEQDKLRRSLAKKLEQSNYGSKKVDERYVDKTHSFEINSSNKLVSMILAFLVLGAVGIAVYTIARDTTRPNISKAPNEPVQELVKLAAWRVDGGLIIPVARYDINGVVLAKRRYRRDRESEMSPIDLSLGWGKMSNPRFISKLSVKQNSRAVFIKPKLDDGDINPWANYYSVPVYELSGNMHIIPANSQIEERIMKLKKYELVKLSGLLVNLESDKGWTWRTSLSRTDSGFGSGEIFWVEELKTF